MAISSTFVTGQVFTAADANLMANSGLVYVAGGALSSTATNFAGCFTSTYENYRIVLSKISLTVGGFMAFRMLNSTTAFTSALYYWAYTNLGSTNAPSTDVGAAASYASLGYSFQLTTDGSFSCSHEIMNPFGTGRTFYTGSSSSYYVTTPLFLLCTGAGGINSTNSFDGIQFLNSNGNTIAGNVAIYRYRKA